MWSLAAGFLIVAATTVAAPSPAPDTTAAQQIAKLQAKVKQLEAALAAHSSPPSAASSASMPGMSPNAGGSMGMGHMKMGGMKQDSAGSMAGGEMSGMMRMMDQTMGRNAMPAASPGMSPSVPQSALPGFPGVSHLYHIGSTGFFLDHAEHISLTTDQQAALSKIKEQALAAKANSDRQIEQVEQEMASLTSADEPDSAKIEAKVHKIEKLRANQRLAFIRSVGDAAKLLTDDQRKILTGAISPVDVSPSPSATMSPMSDM